jgi:hypothetical protein
LYSAKERRLAPLYDQVCTLAWPELSKHISMKLGTAGTLAEVSPEHFQQLAKIAGLSWPMVRQRLKEMADRLAEACRRFDDSPEGEAAAQVPRVIVLERAERMARLAQRAS